MQKATTPDATFAYEAPLSYLHSSIKAALQWFPAERSSTAAQPPSTDLSAPLTSLQDDLIASQTDNKDLREEHCRLTAQTCAKESVNNPDAPHGVKLGEANSTLGGTGNPPHPPYGQDNQC